MARMPATRSPYPAGIANAAGSEGDNPWHQKTESDESKKHMGCHQRSERAVPFHDLQTRPDVELGCDAGTHKTHQHTDSKDRENIHQFPPGRVRDSSAQTKASIMNRTLRSVCRRYLQNCQIRHAPGMARPGLSKCEQGGPPGIFPQRRFCCCTPRGSVNANYELVSSASLRARNSN